MIAFYCVSYANYANYVSYVNYLNHATMLFIMLINPNYLDFA